MGAKRHRACSACVAGSTVCISIGGRHSTGGHRRSCGGVAVQLPDVRPVAASHAEHHRRLSARIRPLILADAGTMENLLPTRSSLSVWANAQEGEVEAHPEDDRGFEKRKAMRITPDCRARRGDKGEMRRKVAPRIGESPASCRAESLSRFYSE